MFFCLFVLLFGLLFNCYKDSFQFINCRLSVQSDAALQNCQFILLKTSPDCITFVYQPISTASHLSLVCFSHYHWPYSYAIYFRKCKRRYLIQETYFHSFMLFAKAILHPGLATSRYTANVFVVSLLMAHRKYKSLTFFPPLSCFDLVFFFLLFH